MCSICPSGASVLLYSLIFFGAISFLISIFFRSVLSFFLSFSFFANILFLGEIFTKSSFFIIYNVEWFAYFSLFVWPIINVVWVFFEYRKKIFFRKK